MNDKSTQKKVNIWQNELLTVREVAAYLRVGRVTVWRWCQQGIIPAARIGRSWRIRRDDLSQFLEAGRLMGAVPVQLPLPVNPNGTSQPQLKLAETTSDCAVVGDYQQDMDIEVQRDGV